MYLLKTSFEIIENGDFDRDSHFNCAFLKICLKSLDYFAGALWKEDDVLR